jgi:hypothetical protein
MESLLPTRSGSYTVCCDGMALHSRYDPAQEAEKYLASLGLAGESHYRFFILIEPGLGYLIPLLQKNHPRTKIIVLHCSGFYASQAAREALAPGIEKARVSEWIPGDGELSDFLEGEIPDTEAGDIKLIEWRPSFTAYGKKCLDILSAAAAFLKRMDANTRTVRGFGRRWLRNSLRNLDIIRRTAGVVRGNSPIVVCAAGPSLEDSLPLIAEWQKFPSPPLIFAVSSSVSALYGAGIEPDMVISTDGGAWASLHLFACVRKVGDTLTDNGGLPRKMPVIASGLSAALPSQLEDIPLLLFCDGLWQQFLLRSLGIPFLNFPMRGTVSAAALDLALYISGGPIFIAGLDLGCRDIVTHARPYAFDRLWEEGAGRCTPFYTQQFVRAFMIEHSGNHEVYASWFKEQLGKYPRRLYALGPNQRDQQKIPALDVPQIPPGLLPRQRGDSCDILQPKEPSSLVLESGLPGMGKNRAITLLTGALNDPLLGSQLQKELGELLFPGEDPRAERICGELECLRGQENSNG